MVMQRSTLGRATPALIIGAIGVAGAVWVSAEFWRHSTKLTRHLLGGQPPTLSTDRDLNELLRPYLYSRDHAVHFVDSSILPVSATTRRKTVHRVGTSTLKSIAVYEERLTGGLPIAFRSYLQDRMVLLLADRGENDRTGWSAIVASIAASIGRDDESVYARLRERAERYLSDRSLPTELRKARQLFDLYESVQPRPEELPFAVATEPGADRWNLLIRTAPHRTVDPDFGRVFAVHQIDGHRLIGEVRARVTSVYANLPLIRPWFAENVIDDAAQVPTEMQVRHFGDGAPLHIVPSSLVIFLGMDVTFEVSESTAHSAMAEASAKRLCCELRGSDLTLSLDPSGVVQAGTTLFRGRTMPGEPRLVAVVSKRRSVQ